MSDTDAKSKRQIRYERDLLALAFLTSLDEQGGHGDENIRMGWWPDDDAEGRNEWARVWATLPDDYGQVSWRVPADILPDWLPKEEPDQPHFSTVERDARLSRYIDPWTAAKE